MKKNSNNINNGSSSANSNHSQTIFTEFRENGLKYIKSQKYYLWVSVFFSTYILGVQLLNILLNLSDPNNYPPVHPPPRDPQINVFWIRIIPFLIFFVIGIISTIHLIYLIKWKKKVSEYIEFEKKQNQENYSESLLPDEMVQTVSLTSLFYDIVDHMVKIRRFFVVLNIVCLIYSYWLIKFFLAQFGIVEPLARPPTAIVHYINLVAQISLIGYLIYQWKQFLHWNRKLIVLEEHEKFIYQEMNF
ncbi:MAG: hypothetical protein KAR35_05555 [Candidatus Heimdallarchaeota archaeon]|nr:hypothetical protein [Candidatus Heimdallarchaeota archaeon]MCK5048824.1 hypothetical protein [Candidatus Heimdallarchaeota archaeon]